MPSRNWFVALAIAALLIGIPSAGRPVAANGFNYTFLPMVTNPIPPCSVPPTLVSPADGAQLSTIAPMLQFSIGDNTGVAQSRLQVGQDPGFASWWNSYSSNFPSAGTKSIRFGLNMDTATTYYWRVYLICGTQTIYSPVRSFRTGSGGVILAAPQVLEPANGAVLGVVAPTIRWIAAPDAVEYQVRVNDPRYASYSYSYTSQTSYYWWGLSPNTTYRLRVIPRNDYAWGGEQPDWYFTTGPAAGAAALDAMPAGSTVIHVNEAGETSVVVEPNTE
jgi:hypothetical protein